MLTPMFCHIDDFCKHFQATLEPHLLEADAETKTTRKPRLSLSEMITIVVYFHRSNFRTFKHYYQYFVCRLLRRFFPPAALLSKCGQLQPLR